MAWDWDFVNLVNQGKMSTSEKLYTGFQLFISIPMIAVSKKNLIFISFNLFQGGSVYYFYLDPEQDCQNTK